MASEAVPSPTAGWKARLLYFITGFAVALGIVFGVLAYKVILGESNPQLCPEFIEGMP